MARRLFFWFLVIGGVPADDSEVHICTVICIMNTDYITIIICTD